MVNCLLRMLVDMKMYSNKFREHFKNRVQECIAWWLLYKPENNESKTYYWETLRIFPGVTDEKKFIKHILQYFPKEVIKKAEYGNDGLFTFVLCLDETQHAMMSMMYDVFEF